MNSFSRFVVFFAAVLLIGLAPVKTAWSADENASVAQVYLEFDPATGQFKSVPATPDNSPDGAMVMSGDHTAQPAATDTAQQNATPAAAAPASSPATVDNTAAAQGGTSPALIGLVVAVVVIGGIVMMMRKKTA